MAYYISQTTENQTTLTVIVKDDGNGTVSYIPEDSANQEYQTYLEWVAEGNSATTWSPTVQDPFVPTPNAEVMFTMEVI